jgi:serine/threonine-protein kinase
MSVEVEAVGTDSLIGQILASRYQIEQRLGEGAMGAVYRAKHVKVGRPFAVKVLHSHLLEDRKTLQRFEREAELAGRLRHPNVIGVVDVGEMPDGTRYMVMDFAAGPDLATLLSEAPFTPQRIIHLVRQMLEGLFHAHQQGLIHRDFKPENVIIEKDSHDAEVPRIVDFGIAILREGGDSTDGPGRLTTNGLVLGTPHYMAPEQAVADPIDHRIDLFALGIMIYEMLCGKLPFDGNGAEVARANLLLDPPLISERVPYLDVDPLLEAFARRLLAKKRENRPATAKAARELLDLVERDRPAAATALGVPLETTRVPMTTQPLAKTGDSTPRSELQTPEQAPPMTAPVAMATRNDPEKGITTDPVGLIDPPRSRWPLIAIAAVVLAGGGFAAYEMLGGSSEPKPATPVASAPPEPAEPAPEPVQVAPTPAAPPAPAPEPVQQPAPVEVKAPEPAHPTPRQHGVRTPPPKATVKTPAPVQPEVKPAEIKPAEVKPAEVKPAEVKPAEVKPTAPPPPTGVDAATFQRQYQAVGAALKRLAVAKGDGAVSDLSARFSLINYNDAMINQTKRDAATAALTALQRDLAGR